jgi:hypothetical protein
MSKIECRTRYNDENSKPLSDFYVAEANEILED